MKRMTAAETIEDFHRGAHSLTPDIPDTDLRPVLDRIFAQSLRSAAAALALLFALLAGGHPFLFPESVPTALTITTAGTAFLLFVLFYVLKRWPLSQHWGYPIGAGIAGLVLLNSLLHLSHLSDPQQTTYLILLIIGAGCFFLSTRWLVLVVTATWLGWGLVVWRAAPSPAWLHFGIALFIATVLSVFVYTVRVRTFRRLEHLRLWEEHHRRALEESQRALQEMKNDLELQVEERTAALVRTNEELNLALGERQRIEQELLCLSQAVQVSTDSIVLTDIEGRITAVNAATLRMYGTDDRGDLIGKSAFDLIVPEDRDQAFTGMQEVLEKGYIESRRCHILIKDGRILPVEMSVALLKDQQGHPVGFTAISRDITERLHAEESLRHSEHRYRSLFENANDALATFTLDGIITEVNRAAEHLLGWSREELLGQHVSKFATPASVALVEERARRFLAGEKLPSATFEAELVRKDGQIVPVEARTRAIRDSGGKPIGFQGMYRDISARKALERQRADFLAMITHDIKNPLWVILGCSEILLEKVREHGTVSGEVEDLLERLRNNALTVHSLVTNYLDLSRIESGHLTLAKKPLAINDVLHQVQQQYEIEARRRRINLRLRLQQNLPPVEGDPLALARVFANLVHNALKFTPERSQVTISSAWQHGEVVGTVTDAGPGIALEKIPLLFEKYKQAGAISHQEGTGLGLFIAKTLVEAHGGRIEVVNLPDHGARFSVFLPAAHNLQAPPSLA